jgi:integrase
MVIVAVDTGLRRSEILELTWADVDWSERQVLVRKSKNADWRVVPLTDRAFGSLQALRQKAAKAKAQRLDNRIFHTKDIGKSLDDAGAQAGIGHVHFHQLRHTFATRLRDRGVPLDRIKELLGHKSMVMVLRYAKARPRQLREAIQALND